MFDRPSASREAFPTPGWKLVWDIWDFQPGKSLASQTLKESYNCQNRPDYRELWSNILSDKSLLRRGVIGHEHLWKPIMTNFTLTRSTKKGTCTSEHFTHFYIHLDPKPYLKSLLTYSHFATNEFPCLRFVGCGQQGMSPFSFHEFVNVYETPVWIGIIFMILMAPMSTRLLRSQTTFGASVLTITKILLEQGSPLSEILLGKVRFRLLGGSILLVGITLNNAYKNKNVYNMIIPRKPVLYSEISELVRDNFKIYTITYEHR